ncbi:dTDP-glucose 4,6-dehydratase [Ramlibacter sp. WS9]|uniref:dTDP-glucose 4,6-dehydratase n=1 Tax=Ramlibacter sp. WS9 TaxID=1882741 RepID=UPI00114308B3|nr:dTDP-glucose 4,6-dehydratase [Ramlibacter sp. WS9]ROZ76035.1 dTDP-glucose 4,6-dehydratase [Ramlibacter sp. WS9]
MLLVTGGCGFIGSAFVLEWLRHSDEPLVNLDLLTYAGHLGNLAGVAEHPAYRFVRGDIADADLVGRLLAEHRPRAVVHFAAESHVDRSIAGPLAFVQTNVLGTARLLQATLAYWESLQQPEARSFRFLNVSTDEVYGSLEPDEAPFAETRQYEPNSPYSASKAAADHMVRAWFHTYGLPGLTTHCSNNYGPRQFPEKLIPLVIHNAIKGLPLPVYGDGQQVRDWLHVNDHCSAIRAVLERGAPGETYNIGGRSERTNLTVVNTICSALDTLRPRADGRGYAGQITHVEDRRGHDRRYAIDDRKIAAQLDWGPATHFDTGIRDTVKWYLGNAAWVESVTSGSYRQWIEQQYPTPRGA